MADRGRARGRGFDGGRGDRGRGTYRGRGGSDNYRGRGGGSYEAGDSSKGRGGEGYRGRGGDRGGGYRGNDRGGSFRGGDRGRGGGRGGRGTPQAFSIQGSFPQPDSTVSRLEDEFEQSLNMRGLSLKSASSFPTRPQFATQGTKITVWANYFSLECDMSLVFYVYSIKVAPKKEKKDPESSKGKGKGKKGEPSGSVPDKQVKGKKLKRIVQLLLEELEAIGDSDLCTDFKATLISKKPITKTGQFEIKYRHDDEDTAQENAPVYSVAVDRTETNHQLGIADLLEFLSMRSARQTQTQRESVIQQLNILFGHTPQCNNQVVTIGQHRHFPAAQNDAMDLGNGIRALRGYFRSVRAATGRLLVNVNVSHGVFYESVPLEKLLRHLAGRYDVWSKYVATKIKLVRVVTSHIKTTKGQTVQRPKTIWGFANPNDLGTRVDEFGAGPKYVKFQLNGKWISVYDYFRQNYPHVRMSDDNPVINVGSDKRPVYVPCEVCTVQPGQMWRRRLGPSETSSMIRYACRRPWENAQSLMGAGQSILGLDSNILKTYGVFVKRTLITVPARILAPPKLVYQGGPINVRDGAWNLQEARGLHKGGSFDNWAILNLENPKTQGQDVMGAAGYFRELAAQMGIRLTKPNVGLLSTVSVGFNIDPRDEARIEDALKRLHTAIKTSGQKLLILVILPQRSDVYKRIKTLADTQLGVHTVCVRQDVFMKRSPQNAANIALKVNLKGGGINHIVDPSKMGIVGKGKTMVVGIDVTHPSPGSSANAPSVAGIVASVDQNLAQWPADLRIQEGRVEMVQGLEDMVKSRLKLWQKHNKNSLPDNILVYRDGVSEGQYKLVLEKELPCFREACKQIYPATATAKNFPKISIIVVGKRHHTRFYPTTTSPNAMDTRTDNCRPGTVVDRGVTEAQNWDFFMQAHQCIQGTARPAHYYVILDEIFRGNKEALGGNLTVADALEDLTHNMSHLFGRATRAVSICPPAYYADLLCERGRCYLAKYFDGGDDASSTTSDSTGGPEERMTKIADTLKDTMFYI